MVFTLEKEARLTCNRPLCYFALPTVPHSSPHSLVPYRSEAYTVAFDASAYRYSDDSTFPRKHVTAFHPVRPPRTLPISPHSSRKVFWVDPRWSRSFSPVGTITVSVRHATSFIGSDSWFHWAHGSDTPV